MMDENETPQLTEDEKKLFEDLMPEDLDEILDTGVNPQTAYGRLLPLQCSCPFLLNTA